MREEGKEREERKDLRRCEELQWVERKQALAEGRSEKGVRMELFEGAVQEGAERGGAGRGGESRAGLGLGGH